MILEVNSVMYSGFEGVQVSLSMTNITGNYSIRSVHRWIGSDTLKSGDACSLWHPDGTELIRGHIGPFNPVLGQSVNIIGRDKSNDLLTSTIDGTGNFANLTLKEIITSICAPFGIDVSGDDGEHIAGFGYNKDAFAADVIRELITRQGFLCSPNGSGGLDIGTITQTRKADFVLQEGVNMLKESQGFIDDTKRHSSYAALGQSWDQNTPSSTFGGGANRHKPFTFIKSGKSQIRDCDTSAEWMAKVSEGSAQYYEVLVKDLQSVVPNTLIDINCPSFGLNNQELIIGGVDFFVDKEGARTKLLLFDPYIFGGSAVENTFL